MKILILKSTLIAVFVAAATNALAWGATGHRIIAQIAEDNLTAKAKVNIEKIVGSQHLAYFANWPDEIKSDTTGRWKSTSRLHYINFPDGMNKQQVRDALDNYNGTSAYSAIIDSEKFLRSTATSQEEMLYALKFLIHFMGDITQPMHLGHEADLGGNRVKIDWFYNETNLHSIWDSKLIDFQKYSYTEYADILERFPQDTSITEGDLKDWIYDTYTQADYVYDDIKNYKKADYKYMYYNKDLMEKQLIKGGLRLAKVLNDIFK